MKEFGFPAGGEGKLSQKSRQKSGNLVAFDWMKTVTVYLLAIFSFFHAGCDDQTRPAQVTRSSSLTHEETAGLAILTQFAKHLIGKEDFPELDPFEPSPEMAIFKNILKEVCPNAMDADVEIGRHGYSIGPQPILLVAGDKTNHVNQRMVRHLDTPGVVRHCEIEYDYTTLDGESGSIPATYLLVEKLIEGRMVRLILSTKRTQQPADGDPEPSS